MALRAGVLRRVMFGAALAFVAGSSSAVAAVDRCLALASNGGFRFATASPERTPLPVLRTQVQADASAKLRSNEARLTFIGHSTFLIESADGVKVATDYNDYVKPKVIPDIVTMNRAHSSHYTDYPSPAIKHVLRGWNPDGGPAEHNIELKDVHVRNLATNTRWSDSGSYGAYGNSIFIFQTAGLCIGHLGHLHHTLTPEQLAAIGQLDVVLVPVDGGYTLDIQGMVEVMKTLRARLIIPMHYFNQFTLSRFLERTKGEWPVEYAPTASIVISPKTMPTDAKILVLPSM
jgi:L-ascorbate metabolism protein UlaG (beta-lactamase superfamily)